MGLEDTEFKSLMYYLKMVKHMSSDEALRCFSLLRKYPDIYGEFLKVTFAYLTQPDGHFVSVNGVTVRDIRLSMHCSVLDSYLELVARRDERLGNKHMVKNKQEG